MKLNHFDGQWLNFSFNRAKVVQCIYRMFLQVYRQSAKLSIDMNRFKYVQRETKTEVKKINT